jgi:hypothetical protein
MVFLIVISFSISCSSSYNATKGIQNKTKAESIVEKAITAHGGYRYDNSHYSFTFRKKKYSFQNLGVRYTYTAESNKDGKVIFDKLDNLGLSRSIDGKLTQLSEEQNKAFSGSLNSVIYFATLPHKLKDPAVIKSYKGETLIKGEKYHIIEVRFSEEGGGQDHDDIFHYWIAKDDSTIDYLAYNYKVNGGGVRFRSAYNRRIIDGIIFQDYVNYKAPVGTDLIDLPELFESDQLKKLSLIETENVVHLK